MAEPKAERRKQPRAKGAVGLTVGAEPHVTGVQVKDISLSGLSFRINRPVEFMTRLIMTLVFPVQSGPAGKPHTPIQIECEGAVVRCEPVYDGDGNQYEVAVFFTHLDFAARGTIEKYVKNHL